MKKEDFKHPRKLTEVRLVILKGETYECQGTIVMATKTTCSLTSNHFSGVCVWVDTSTEVRNPVGQISDDWLIINFNE